ncbi:hypothetical protein G647_06432 [Cladophialophora carrionii CBS 160.54]|uniref:Piwi domain-containing protein n=1 Tax=Cladophialophora carrionii CBS 160.54 TaxID=1279043 RepID=V9D7U3_9EURO|nr:uncharacterized protein G647_06432 [Cladophialophora carrionii CBS 160.54]ETI22358.1 hypothetical protein G647_06432 [Cladophialophora carrionii CBS 160.54]
MLRLWAVEAATGRAISGVSIEGVEAGVGTVEVAAPEVVAEVAAKLNHGTGDSALPDTATRQLENQIQDNVRLEQKKTSPLVARLPLRPGFGTQGREVLLWTNYFQLVSYGGLLLHRYGLDISPDQAGRRPAGKKVRRIIELLLEEHLGQYSPGIATDFKTNLISSAELDIDQGAYTIVYRTEHEDEPEPNAKRYRVRLLRTASLTVSELLDELTSTRAGTLLGSKEEIIQALNIVVGHHPKAASQVASIGSNRHYALNAAASDRMALGAGLAAIRGFFISVRVATGRLLVNVQVKHGAFYEEGPLEQLMAAHLASTGNSKAKLAKFVKKLSVNVTHIIRRNRRGDQIPRIKSISGLATRRDGVGLLHPPIVPELGAGSKGVMFWLESSAEGSSSAQQGGGVGGKKGKKPAKADPKPPPQGRYTSVYDYFRSEYNIVITKPALPVINVGTLERPSYLPAQVCHVIAGQASNAQLTPAQTQQMIRFAVRGPAQNAQSIVTSGAQMLTANNPTLDAFGIGTTPRLMTVPGRVLNSPSVRYGAQQTISTRFGSWNMVRVQFTTKADLKSWTYLWISTEATRDPWSHEGELQTSVIALTSKLRELGMACSDCTRGLHITIAPNTIESTIDEALHRFTSTPEREPPKLVLVILPYADGPIYNRVKHACDVREGLINVCVVASKFARKNEQYLANVGLKFNLKLGGLNQSLEPSKLGILSEGKTMVVGIDVTHPSPGSLATAPSVVGVVASVDKWLGQWPAALAIQTARKEMVSGLKALMESRLRMWKKHNGTYPENILIYRDGVSEGQYNLVLDQELPEIRSACTALYPVSMTKKGIPRITIIIVGKRHNTRFYPTRADQADRSSNPQNGTVVDRGVTEARNWDFFMQAHTAIQGTARPAHYYVIFDEIFQARKVQQAPFENAADVLEDLTHNMCYLFGRATKAVSICPPAYYADLVCERARCYLSGLFSPSVTSSAGSMAEGEEAPLREPDSASVTIHQNVRDTMFYL